MLQQRGRLHAQAFRNLQVTRAADLNRTDPSCLTSHGSWCSPALTKASTSENASHEAGDVLAGLKAVPICCWSDGCWRWPRT